MQENNQNEIKLMDKNKWIRAVYMAVFIFIGSMAVGLISLIAVAQFLFVLVSNKPNLNLLIFAKSLSLYVRQAAEYLTYNSEEKPFPFSNWPVDNKKD